jgi:N-acetylglucosamine kinase-like BadF-type ATPase
MTALVLGLDAGGTRTVCLLARADDGAILGRGVGGPGNVRAAGVARVTASFKEAITAAFAAANLPQESVAAVAVGAAGAARPDDHALVEGALRGIIDADHYVVTNDAAIALRAALPDGPGVLLIAGTGSIGYGRTVDGEEVRSGGWGYLLDDVGSAYAVGLAGLTAVLRAHDGRGAATMLATTILLAWDLPNPEAIIGQVYQQPVPRERIAALAPLVADAAWAGDVLAMGIITAAGSALGELAVAILRKLGTAPDIVVPLVTDGGFLRATGPLLVPPLLDTITAHGFAVAQRHATVEAAQGAVALARVACG